MAGGPESPAAYNVHCERTDLVTNIDVVADAAYWTDDGIATMSVGVTASDDGSIDGLAAATEWVLPFARLAGGDAAVRWMQQHLGDAPCLDGRTELVRGGQLSYRSGTRGGQTLHFVAPVPTR
jgi:hypothetical protein